MEQAEQICDFIFLINGGKKVIDGPLSAVRKSAEQAVMLDYDGDGSSLHSLPGVGAHQRFRQDGGIVPRAGNRSAGVVEGPDDPREGDAASTSASLRCTKSSYARSAVAKRRRISPMVKNKTWLVALREYTENLRTKRSGSGSFRFPVILIIAVVVPSMLAKVKDVRRYAVIDSTGWLLPAIEERAQYDDVLQLLKFLQRQADKGESAVAKLPTAMRAMAAGLDKKRRKQLETKARWMTALGKSFANLQWTAKSQEGAGKEEASRKSRSSWSGWRACRPRMLAA